MSTVPVIAALSSKGIFLVDGHGDFSQRPLRDENTSNIRSIVFSPKGKYFAWRNDRKTEVLRCADWSVIASIPGAVKDLSFSPLDTYFIIWEMFIMNKENPQGKPNMHVYQSESGEHVQSFVQKNQLGWEPQWSSDEKLFAWQDGTRVLIYEDGKLDRYTHHIHGEKLKSFSVSPSSSPTYYFSTFIPAKSGQPAFWKVFQFPQFEATQCLVSKSSFQADNATFYWNRRGTNVLIMTTTDVDKTGASYYGRQMLAYADVKGNSGGVTFSKDGPIHAVSWNPGNWNEWVAVYGHMPAKATVFNTKCEPLFEFGSGIWNYIYFSPEGSKLVLAGFGNVSSGAVDVWDPRGNKKLGSFTSLDTTYLQWDPRSECIVTATTHPRLTVNNGFKVWHYTGALLLKRDMAEKEHLLGISWQSGNFPKSELSKAAPKGIADPTPRPSAAAYRPPGARGRPAAVSFHLYEAPHKPGETANGPSKAAIKQKEKREARKAKKAEEKAAQGPGGDEGGDAPAAPASPATPRPAFVSTGDPEKDKKIKNLQKKLNDIEKLKEMKAAGKPLELNQKAKIESEKTLQQELQQLRL